MQTLSLKQTLRPNKIGIIVPIDDKDALMEAIKLNTFLWGGSFNPIIPFYRNAPEHWNYTTREIPSSKEIIEGYIDTYDPDFILPINLKNNEIKNIDIGDRTLLKFSDIFNKFGSNSNNINYGIEVFYIWNHFINEELKYKREDKINMIIPNFTDEISPFIASVFGCLSNEHFEVFSKQFEKRLGAERLNIDYGNYAAFLKPETFFLRKATAAFLKVYSARADLKDVIFYFDADNYEDIIDYWNLRAIVPQVLPVPIQAHDFESTKQLVNSFIDENYYPLNAHNVYNFSTIVKSRNLSVDDLQAFPEKFNLISSPAIALQSWYPPIWERAEVKPINLSFDEIEREVSVSKKHFITIPALKPSFHIKYGQNKYANELKLTSFTGEDFIAQAFPEKHKEGILSGILFGFGRISQKGIVVFPDYNINLHLPTSEVIFLNWLKTNGWQAETGSLFGLTKQAIKYIGGMISIPLLENKKLIDLISKLDGSKYSKNGTEIEIEKIIESQQIKPKDKNATTKAYIKTLIDKRIIQLGLKIKCPVCLQHSWFPIDEIKYDNNKCHKCMEDFSIPTHDTDKLEWCYKSVGPFASIDNGTNPLLNPLLTLNFFNKFKIISELTPIFNVKAQKEDKDIEIDLGLFYKEDSYEEERTHIILAECKSSRDFKPADINRLKFIAKQMPNSILVLSTFKEKLSKKEIESINSLIKEVKEKNHILILTGNELFIDDHFSFRDKWESLGGVYEGFTKNGGTYDLLSLCKITQQIYLDKIPNTVPNTRKILDNTR